VNSCESATPVEILGWIDYKKLDTFPVRKLTTKLSNTKNDD